MLFFYIIRILGGKWRHAFHLKSKKLQNKTSRAGKKQVDTIKGSIKNHRKEKSRLL